MKSVFASRISKLNLLLFLCALGVTTLSLPVTAVPQEVCVKISSDDVACGIPVLKPSSSQNQVASDETRQAEVNDAVTWELKSCVRQQEKVSCLFSLSSSQDTVYRVGINAVNNRMVDGEGTSYHPSLIQIGTNKITTSYDIAHSVGNAMAKGVHYKAIIEFKNVSTSVSQIALLTIVPMNMNYSTVVFRNVPIN